MPNLTIEMLEERVSKSSHSKLFLLLAQQYKEKGLFDKSIEILTKGLQNQPDSISARVALGTVYLEKNMTLEARKEFEKVMESTPDNLFVCKKLAQIYFNKGELDRVKSACRTILKFDKNDKDANKLLNETLKIENERTSELSKIGFDTEAVGAQPIAEQAQPAQEAKKESHEGAIDFDVQIEESAPKYPSKSADDFLYSSHDDNDKATQEASKSPHTLEEEIANLLTPRYQKTSAVVMESDESKSDRVGKDLETEAPIFRDTAKNLSTNKENESVNLVDEDEDEERFEIESTLPTETMADICITQGLYDEAIKIYDRLLSLKQDNKRILQKRNELSCLIDLINAKKKENKIKQLSNLIGKVEKKAEVLR
jgi:tetratricopeptide (TPR) repeat protein